MRTESIQSRIRQFALNTPGKTAIEFGNEHISYKELDEYSWNIADFLVFNLLENKNIVLFMKSGYLLVEAILGIIKSGGVFVPVDPDFPSNRVSMMIDEVKAEWVFTEGKHLEKLNEIISGRNSRINVVVMNKNPIWLKSFSSLNLFTLQDCETRSSAIEDSVTNKHCYIYFTSGSSGKPKAVLGRHRSLQHFIDWEISEFGVNRDFRVSQLTSPSFDPFLRDIFIPLCSGGTLCIPENRDLVIDFTELAEWIKCNEITLSHMVPSIIRGLSSAATDKDIFSKLRFILIAGEMLRGMDIKNFFDAYGTGTQLVNLYGPTETTLAKMFYRICEDDVKRINIPVGKPIDMTQILILDNDLKKCQKGSIGEIHIRTPFISSGYYNDADLTRKVFIKNPYGDNEQDIIYKTGDIGRVLPDGNIECIGRKDFQIKIRGMRIEPGEIENCMLGNEAIKEAVVDVKEDKAGGMQLCAYYTVNSSITASEIRGYLSKYLPEYMIPGYFCILDEIPLTPTGKVNRNLLPEPWYDNMQDAEYEAPYNDIQAGLEDIWKDILGRERIGINSNFFEIGGHSLRATTLVSMIHKYFNVEIPIRTVFEKKTIKELAEVIANSESNLYSSIKPVPEKDYYELSAAQKRVFILNQLEGEEAGYNISGAVLIEGQPDLDRLKNTFKTLIDRHESLRTSFLQAEGEPVQIIHRHADFDIEVLELETGDNDYNNLDINEKTEAAVRGFVRCFDLIRPPLLRVGLIKISSDKYIMVHDLHHIISDGTSMAILVREFAEIYSGRELPPLTIQYKDFAAWQNKFLKSSLMKKQEQYWLNQLAGDIEELKLPTDYQRPLIKSFEGDRERVVADAELTSGIMRLASESGATLYMTLLAAFNVLLWKYTGQQDILMGSPIAGRSHADLENVIGMFVNTLVMRNRPGGSKSFGEFLNEVRQNALTAYENKDYPFEELVEKLALKRDLSRNPLFDVMFVLQNMSGKREEARGIKLANYEFVKKVSKFDIMLQVVEQNGTIVLEFEYCTKLFTKDTIKRLAGHYINILKHVTKEPNIKLFAVEMLSQAERKQLLEDFNKTEADYDPGTTIHQLFEKKAAEYAESISLVYKAEQLTYRELNEKANLVARILRRLGVKRNSAVGVMLKRSPSLIISILGILKAGAAYLPIDEQLPPERIRLMLEESNALFIIMRDTVHGVAGQELSMQELMGHTVESGAAAGDEKPDSAVNGLSFVFCKNSGADSSYSIRQALLWDNLENSDACSEAVNPANVNMPEDLLYIIYTSGSTGIPKGVMLEHRNLVNLLNFEYSNTCIDFRSNVLQFTTIGFDVSFQEIFSTLLAGGRLFLIDRELRDNIYELFSFINEKAISVLFLPPSYLNLIFSEEDYISCFPETIKHIVTAGEQLIINPALKEFIQNRGICLHNHYGPAETHVVTTFTITPDTEIPYYPPIGKPISNTQIYILDKQNSPVPVSVPGELYIAGNGVGRGYINSAQLTEERFVPNPFQRDKLMYRTGDLAKWLPDGNIEFQGRTDYQVKIRGFRIELGEIESAILKHSEIRECVVTDRTDSDGSKFLCAYVVLRKDFDIREMKNFLSGSLPEYMIPQYFIKIDRIPLNSNGKVDRKALGNVEFESSLQEGYIAPQNELQAELISIWKSILGVGKIGIDDNFFELGGHSLKGTTLVARIYKQFNVQITLRDIFANQTVRQLSQFIGNSEKSKYFSIKPLPEKDFYPLSSAQKRLYLIQQSDTAQSAYNMPCTMLLSGEPDRNLIEEIFKSLIERHEPLRTSFDIVEGVPVQRVHSRVEFKIDYTELAGFDSSKEDENRAIKNIISDFIRPFDLGAVPVFRVSLVKMSEHKYVLMYDMHHIISDGVSMNILVREFMELYKGSKLADLPIQYKDYAVWQNELLKSEAISRKKQYWLNRYSGEIPVLNMPADFPRPPIRSYTGKHLHFAFDQETRNGLYAIASETGTTLYMVLLALYNILLSKYTGQEDIIVGTPSAGRTHPDLENIVGIFVNSLAMRNFPRKSMTFKAFLQEVKENCINVFNNQEYQFEELFEDINIKRDLSRNPLFDTTFILQNMEAQSLEIEGLKIELYSGAENSIAKVDLSLVASETGTGIGFNLTYSTALYKEATIKKIVDNFVKISEQIIEDIDIRLEDIRISNNVLFAETTKITEGDFEFL